MSVTGFWVEEENRQLVLINPKERQMSKTVKGFNVKGQDRQNLRSELAGEFEGRKWFIRCEKRGVFWWTIGDMSGYGGPTVADILRTLRKAAKAQAKLEEVFGPGSIPSEAYNNLRLLGRWEQRAFQGRLTITGPHGTGDKSHFRVKEADLA